MARGLYTPHGLQSTRHVVDARFIAAAAAANNPASVPVDPQPAGTFDSTNVAYGVGALTAGPGTAPLTRAQYDVIKGGSPAYRRVRTVNRGNTGYTMSNHWTADAILNDEVSRSANYADYLNIATQYQQAVLAANAAAGKEGLFNLVPIVTTAFLATLGAAELASLGGVNTASLGQSAAQPASFSSSASQVSVATSASSPASLTDTLTQQVLTTGTTLPTSSLTQAATDTALGAGGSVASSGTGSLLDTLYQGAQQAGTKIGTGIVQNAAATVTSAEMAKLIPKPTPPKPVQAPMPAAQTSHGFGAIAVGLLAVVAAVKFGLLAA